jgi:group II intron reverse transcriptase/maturase
MADILNAIYEPKFCEISYGYRQGKSCHDAVKQLGKQLMSYTNWVVDADIKGFFDNISHEWMMKFLEHDISDKNFLRYVKRFLKSGMMEEGKRLETDKGAPQGGIISPVLANVYLHYALDLWFEKGVKKKAKGYCAMIRYADDTVFCFQHENEARAFYRAFTDRLSKFGLEVSSEKTKIIRFGRFAKEHGSKETFDFLGFTATGVTTRKGKYQPQFLASKKKLKAKKQAVKKWLRENRHEKINTLIKRLNQKLRGLYNYYGIQGNSRRLYGFYWYIRQQLKTVLNKRSQKDKTTWERLQTILKYTPVLAPRIAAGQY